MTRGRRRPTATAKYQRARTRRIRRCASDAIDLIHERGWRQGKPGRGGSLGLWEAIWESDPATMRADRVDTVAPNVIASIESMICATTRMRHLVGGKKLIPRWNDARGRTVEQVIGMLHAVASGADRDMPFCYRDYLGRLLTMERG